MSDPARFDALCERYHRAWFRFHPEEAVAVGETAHAGRLAPFGDDDIGALIALDEKLLDALDEIDPTGLDPDRALDHALLRGAAELELHELLERDWRRRDPVRYLPVEAIHQIAVRPLPDPAAALAGRLGAVPGHLRAARAHLAAEPEAVVPAWAELAVEEARAGAAFVRGLAADARLGPVVAAAPGLAGLAGEAAAALEAFAAFLEGEVLPRAAGTLACGRLHFERLLRLRHGLELDAEGLRRFGEALVGRVERSLAEACAAVAPRASPQEVLARLRGDRPEAEALLARYREAMAAARAFVLARGLVTAPPRERLEVVATPPFLRPRIPFAAYLEPAPHDPEQAGTYYVTVPEDEAGLAAHHEAAIRLTSVHEAWPGHHLQFVTAHLRPASRTWTRLLNPSATLYEGWALYCEQLMLEQGFLDRPEERVLVLHDRLWRALRVLVDVGLQVDGVGPGVARRLLVDRLGFAEAQAAGEVAWYGRAPTVPMGYALGWALIDALRGVLGVDPGDAAALRRFHDRLLSAGSVALPRVVRRVFGEAAWVRAAAVAFGTHGA
ncbi:DUF885 domain-containing protein [Inmirania thermothiophila]|uniref:Uncharacterized protein (DUF885 family) n=1 Tax=Inmirania thermothiophila TaxID=1750597 RepID=A0A3N1XSE1_9GAMM|nr:DUF885 domain-containing protein [Inmirania thermothiophila]ROR29573.1 uncharacterized protein (DUF885 family) [Inmirania thermothiophila]